MATSGKESHQGFAGQTEVALAPSW